MRVLLVEDSQRLQKSICFALQKSGYVIDTSGDGENGLWLAESNDYDVNYPRHHAPRVWTA